MTIREAINKQCDNDYFVAKAGGVKTYKNAITDFVYDFIMPALEEIGTEFNDRLKIHIDNSIEQYYQHEQNSKLYAITMFTTNIFSEFILKITAVKSEDGWNISFSQRDGILDCTNLFNFICSKKISELENKIQEMQEQIDKIKVDINV